MSRWKLLREKLSGGLNSNSVSIHRHSGFHLLPKKRCIWQWKITVNVANYATWEAFFTHCVSHCERADTSEILLHIIVSDDKNYIKDEITEIGLSLQYLRQYKENEYFFTYAYIPLYPHCTYSAYTLPTSVVYTRERAAEAALSVSDLLSHQVHGVDNTGNVCVWEAETILLHTMMTHFADEIKDKVVLELGGGSTALCGLGLAAASECKQVIVTDGHPDCVRNQISCITVNQQNNTNLKPITSHRLRWATGDVYGELAVLPKAQVVIAADCLFFRDFHDDLIWLLRHAIVCDATVYLLQPERSGSMREFIRKAQPFFDIEEIRDYNSQVTRMHEQQMLEQLGAPTDKRVYSPDIHYPVLLLLRLKL